MPKDPSKPKVFVSHASVDKPFVDEFVADILQIGLGLPPKEIFYSSSRVSGVRSGRSMMHQVREEVAEAAVVVAIVSPSYQHRPVCVAELGAAWGSGDPDRLVVFRTPNMSRSELDGVLPDLLINPIDASDALSELADRIEEVLGATANRTQWDNGLGRWLGKVAALTKALERPATPSGKEYESVQKRLSAAEAARDALAQEAEDWKDKFAQLELAKDRDEAVAIRVGDSHEDAVEAQRELVAGLLRTLGDTATEAIFFDLRNEPISAPDVFGDRDDFNKALSRDLVVEGDPGGYVPNIKKRTVREAVEAVGDLDRLITKIGQDEATSDWFYGKFGAEPSLRDRDCWDALFG